MRTENPVSQIGTGVRGRGPDQRQYRARLATTAADVRAAQTLRFLVFNLELNEGLEESYATCRDADAFDGVCDHLLVEELPSRDVVGTYRLQSGTNAAAERGYFSAQEFDLAPFEPFRTQMIEVGRACVHSQHRNATVLSLLWKGIAAFARDHGSRYLIGCCSIASPDAKVGAWLYRNCSLAHLAPPEWQTQPQPDRVCPLDPAVEQPCPWPRLLLAYLSLGARICGPPAINRSFRKIDFLAVLDLRDLPSHVPVI